MVTIASFEVDAFSPTYLCLVNFVLNLQLIGQEQLVLAVSTL